MRSLLLAAIVLLASAAITPSEAVETHYRSLSKDFIQGNFPEVKRASGSIKKKNILLTSTTSSTTYCGCANKTLCIPVQKKYDKEVFAYSTDAPAHWTMYDYTRLTAIVQYSAAPYWPMYCKAREHGVRMIMAPPVPLTAQLTNKTARQMNVESAITNLLNYTWDGINIDFEHQINETDSASREALNMYMVELGEKMRPNVLGGGQLSFAVAWRAGGIDNRWYDYRALMYLCDFVVIMDYDTRSQVFDVPQCNGGPNAPASTVFEGIESYLSLYNDSSKLVYGVPWYGYVYPCYNTYEGPGTPCHTGRITPPWRGCNCSDASGGQWQYNTMARLVDNRAIPGVNYSLIGNQIVNATPGTASNPGGLWVRQDFHMLSQDESIKSSSPDFLPGLDKEAKFHSAFFDNPATLVQKYIIAKKYNLRGLSMWNIDIISYSEGGRAQAMRDEYWDIMDAFLV